MTAPLAPFETEYVIPGTETALAPGTWGVSHGSGLLGRTINRCEREMTRSDQFPGGDLQAAWAGHAFRYVGLHRLRVGGPAVPCIVEAEWPTVKLSPVTAHRDAIWAVGEPMDEETRHEVVAGTLGLLGIRYDPLVYPLFLARTLGAAVSHDLGPLFTDPHLLICSGVVAVEERRVVWPANSPELAALAVAATSDPNLTSPADLLAWGLAAGQARRASGQLGWMHMAPPVGS